MPLTIGTREHNASFREERAELAAILASPMFARSSNLSKILTYICERYFAGQAASVKEYTIAVEALGRKPEFNPDRDSIVRVEATRLRKRLKQYYKTEGAAHAIHIGLPETGYVPQFVSKAAPEAAPDELAPDIPVASTPKMPVRRLALAAGA